MAEFNSSNMTSLLDLINTKIPASTIKKETFDVGSKIFSKGDIAENYYIIEKGTVSIEDDNIIFCQITEDAGFGEMAILNSQTQVLTATAHSKVTLSVIPYAVLVQLSDKFPELVDELFQQMQKNLQLTMLNFALSKAMGKMDTESFNELENCLKWQTYHAGEVLFEQGDIGKQMLLIVTGRVRVTHQDSVNIRILGELGRGYIIGEIALLNDLPRSATVTAIRETTIVSMNQDTFNDLIEKSSTFAKRLLPVIAQRYQQGLEEQVIRQCKPMSFVLMAGQSNVNIEQFADDLTSNVANHGRTIVVNEESFNKFFNSENLSVNIPTIVKQQWINKFEEAYDYIFYIDDEICDDWKRWITANTDRVLIVEHAKNTPQPENLNQCNNIDAQHQRHELILLHTPDTERPSGTARWLDAYSVARHHHIKQKDTAHYARVARLLTGNGIGFVLGGGGARGYAHVGVIKALVEENVPIDAIGCVSIGSIVGGVFLAGFHKDDIVSFILENAKTYGSKKSMTDVTIPISALMRSKKVSESMKSIYGDMNIEDGWIQFYCVSTNLTKQCLNIHRQGKLHEAIRASISIPGVFSPVVRNGDLVVDGGVMNNFPVDIMHDYLEGGTTIGTVVKGSAPKNAYEIDDNIDGLSIMLSRFIPLMKRQRVPSILKTIMASSSVNAYINQAENRKKTDLLLETNTSPYGTMDFDNISELIQIGYETHQQTIKGWAENNKKILESN